MSASMEGKFATYAASGNAVGSTLTSPPGALQAAGITQLPHVFIGLTFTDSDGNAVTPGAGTYTVTAETLNNPGVFQAITGGTAVSASAAATTLSVAANLSRVRVALSGITTATLFNIYLTGNIS